jgi:5,6-dimethylbenzimidazole synthase
VQNLWLAARAEGLGVGWVSIFHGRQLREILHVPDSITIVAYLCVGYVDGFLERPDLEAAGWLPRQKLADLVWFDAYQNRYGTEPLLGLL